MGKRLGLILGVAAVGALLAGTWHPLASDGGYPIPAGEEFAVWPVDTVVEAEDECVGADDWRRSAEETAEHFAREVLRIENLRVGDLREIGKSESTISVFQGKDPWGVGINLREAFGCWYVTHADEADDDVSAPPNPVGYSGTPPNRSLFLRVPAPPGNPEGDAFYTGSLGSGSRQTEFEARLRSDDPDRFVTVRAAPDLPGHYMYISHASSSGGLPSLSVDTVPPPPDPADTLTVPSLPEVRALLRADLRGGRPCNRLWAGGDEAERAANHHLWISEVRGDGRRSLTGPFALENGDYRGTLDEVVVEFDFWHPKKGCTALQRVTTRGDHPEGVRAVEVSEDAFEFDLEWGRATEAQISYGFGWSYLDMTVAPIDDHLAVLAFEKRLDPPGFYYVTFYRDGRVIAVEGGAVPSVSSLQTSET